MASYTFLYNCLLVEGEHETVVANLLTDELEDGCAEITGRGDIDAATSLQSARVLNGIQAEDLLGLEVVP